MYKRHTNIMNMLLGEGAIKCAIISYAILGQFLGSIILYEIQVPTVSDTG